LKVSLTNILTAQSNFLDPKHHTVGIWYLGKKTEWTSRSGGDLVQISSFSLDDIPSLKFPNDVHLIKHLHLLE